MHALNINDGNLRLNFKLNQEIFYYKKNRNKISHAFEIFYNCTIYF